MRLEPQHAVRPWLEHRQLFDVRIPEQSNEVSTYARCHNGAAHGESKGREKNGTRQKLLSSEKRFALAHVDPQAKLVEPDQRLESLANLVAATPQSVWPWLNGRAEG